MQDFTASPAALSLSEGIKRLHASGARSVRWRIAVVVAFSGIAGTAHAQGVACTPEPTVMVIGYGETVNCDIGVSGDTDSFQFAATAGDVITVQGTPGRAIPCLLSGRAHRRPPRNRLRFRSRGHPGGDPPGTDHEWNPHDLRRRQIQRDWQLRTRSAAGRAPVAECRHHRIRSSGPGHHSTHGRHRSVRVPGCRRRQRHRPGLRVAGGARRAVRPGWHSSRRQSGDCSRRRVSMRFG